MLLILVDNESEKCCSCGAIQTHKMENQQSQSKIRNLLDLLPPEQKDVVMLRHYFDFSFKEIATMQKISLNTALGRMRYGLINMRKMMAEKQIAL